MKKESAYSPARELVFILACIFVMTFSAVQTIYSIHLSLMGLSLLVVSAMLLVLVRRRVVAAWRGACQALSDARYLTLSKLDSELAAQKDAEQKTTDEK